MVVTPSWLVFAVYIVLLYQPLVRDQVGDGQAYFVGAALALMLLASVLLHEVGHCLVARAFGLPVRSITITLMAGRTEITRPPQTPAREYAVAIVGPMVSLLLTACGAGAAAALREGSLSYELCRNLAIANGALTVLNLLPGLPLDGGRVLRSVLWRLLGDADRATEAAARSGMVVAVLVVPTILLIVLPALGIGSLDLTMFLVSTVVSTFVFTGALATLRQSRLTSRLPSLSVAALARPALAVPAGMPLSEALRQAHEQALRAMVIVGGGGRPEALVNEAWVRQVPVERRPWVTAAEGARAVEPHLVLDPGLVGEALLEAMTAAPASEYLVEGEPTRVLVAADVAAALGT